MRKTSLPPVTQTRRTLCRLASLIACALIVSACVPPAFDVSGTPPKFDLNEDWRSPCAVTAGDVSTLSALESRDRARGSDVKTCDDVRRNVVLVFDIQQSAWAKWVAARGARNSRACRWLHVGCGT